jgi:phosphoribosylformylglycinamidine synthase subunit PurQ / glutaminase
MATPRVLILRAPGTNCDEETAFAFQRAGATPVSVHINQLLQSPHALKETQILCLAGGFSYGDDLGAGRVLAVKLRHFLRGALEQFREEGKLILGICNGFQVLVQLGILLPDLETGPAVTLAWNDRGMFEDRWVELQVASDHCEFLRGMSRMYLPVAHAEGKFVPHDANVLEQLEQHGQLVLRYARLDGGRAGGEYPWNPNGAIADVAGVCDSTGRVFGLMPHPERFIHYTQHPRWTRETLPEEGEGFALFRNAVQHFA